MAKMIVPFLGSFNVQDLTNTAWAFAVGGPKNQLFFGELASVVKHRLYEFDTD